MLNIQSSHGSVVKALVDFAQRTRVQLCCYHVRQEGHPVKLAAVHQNIRTIHVDTFELS